MSETTNPRNEAPLPDALQLLRVVGEFGEEMRSALDAVKTSGTEFVAKLERLESQFSRRLKILTDEVARVSQQQVAINERLGRQRNELERIKLEITGLQERVSALESPAASTIPAPPLEK